MEMFGKNFSDDLNEWAEQTLNDIVSLFNQSISKGREFQQKVLNQQKKFQNDKPDREKVIQKDEITNLKIALAKAATVEDFLKDM